MANNSIGPGDILDYTNGGSAIASGDPVVMGDLVGVALVDIASGETGSVQIAGAFTLPKIAGTAWAQGDKLDWDASVGAFGKGITSAAGDVTLCAVAAKAAASGDTAGEVKLTPGVGTGV